MFQRLVTVNFCEDVAASLVPTVAAAASSGTSVLYSRHNFSSCIITVMLPSRGRFLCGKARQLRVQTLMRICAHVEHLIGSSTGV